MNEKIVLDKSTFKALSVDSRVDILKLLTQRNHILSEVSAELGLSNSTIKEHLDILVNAGLIKRLDEGRKWKYYKLTFKGRNFIEPKEVRVLFAFAISVVTALGSAFYLLKDSLFRTASFAASNEKMVRDIVEADMMLAEAAPTTQQVVQDTASSIPWFPIIVLILSAVIIGYAVGYYLKKDLVIVKKK